ncbi:hypothetical protein HG531_007362 [Fusarium graminearum]|nr:hypothetical protein HG531_007362 [Fusarium graminearum]
MNKDSVSKGVKSPDVGRPIDEIGWGQVQVDVLEAEQGGKDESTAQQFTVLARENKRHDENTVHEAIVLESDGLSSTARLEGSSFDKGLKRPDENKLGNDDRSTLEVDGLPAIVVEVVDLHHEGIYETSNVGEYPFEVSEEGRVIQSPFRSLFDIPLLQRKAVRDSEPIAMDFKVGGFAADGD